MAWTTVPGLAGKVYLPDDAGQMRKKYPCKGCFSCQWCDENRCQVCRNDSLKVNGSAAPNCGGCHLSKPANTHRPYPPSSVTDRVCIARKNQQ